MGEPPVMKYTGRTFSFFWMLVALVLAGSAQIGAQGQGGSGAQSSGEGADSPAAKAAARKQKFEAMKKRMELGEEGAESLDEGDEGGGVMRIISVTRRVNTRAGSRGATETARARTFLLGRTNRSTITSRDSSRMCQRILLSMGQQRFGETKWVSARF